MNARTSRKPFCEHKSVRFLELILPLASRELGVPPHVCLPLPPLHLLLPLDPLLALDARFLLLRRPLRRRAKRVTSETNREGGVYDVRMVLGDEKATVTAASEACREEEGGVHDVVERRYAPQPCGYSQRFVASLLAPPPSFAALTLLLSFPPKPSALTPWEAALGSVRPLGAEYPLSKDSTR